MMLRYEDFRIRIGAAQDGIHAVHVVSPAGECASTFEIPQELSRLSSLPAALGPSIRGDDGSARAVGARKSPGQKRLLGAEQVGDQLFKALFFGPVLSLLDQSLGQFHGNETGLRLRLSFDPQDPTLMRVSRLPWELLYREQTGQYFCLSERTPLVRHLGLPVPANRLPVAPPFRVLVAVANPRGTTALNLDRELDAMRNRIGNRSDIEIDWLTQATPAALLRHLRQSTYHAFHFMGHGEFDERTGEGKLLFEDEQGGPLPMMAGQLGIYLRDEPSLRLVVLNACETAEMAGAQRPRLLRRAGAGAGPRGTSGSRGDAIPDLGSRCDRLRAKAVRASA